MMLDCGLAPRTGGSDEEWDNYVLHDQVQKMFDAIGCHLNMAED